MGKSRSSSTTNQTTQTSNVLDDASRNRINQYNDQADNFLSSGFQNYVQGLSVREQQARDLADQTIGTHTGGFDTAQGLLDRASQDVNYNSTVGDLSQYTNQFEGQVIDANNAEFDYNRDRAANDVNARIALDGGYGSSGHALGLAELEGQFARAQASTNSQLRYDNYNNALNLDRQDRLTDLQAQQFNRQNQAGIAGQYANLADQQQAHDARNIGLLDALGASERQIDQNQALAQYQDDWQRYNAFTSERQLAGGLADRFGTSNTNGTTETVSSPSIGQQIGGIVGGLGGLSSVFGGGGIGGAVNGISSLFGFGGQNPTQFSGVGPPI